MVANFHRIVTLVGLSFAALLPSPARAYSIGSGFSAGCHEQITADAYEPLLAGTDSTRVRIPADEGWRQVGRFLAGQVDIEYEALSPSEFYILTSLLIGVRSPDTDGHAILNLENARALHLDPSDEGQYAHALRGIDDDGEAGDAVAVAGLRAQILHEVELAEESLRTGEVEREAFLFFDGYGRESTTVWAPAYHLGRAAHALQDSFSHTIRDESDEFHTILSVFNYAEAVANTLDEERDGIAHSDEYDQCTERNAPVVDAARLATQQLIFAAIDRFTLVQPMAVHYVLETWVQHRPGCSVAAGLCGNERWLAIARDGPTGPYLCSPQWGRVPDNAWLEVFCRAWICALFYRRLRRRRRLSAA